jgi:hypothetical protein
LLVVGLPVVILVTVVLPVAGLISLYRSWTDARRFDVAAARWPTLAILVSQAAGGILTIVVMPLLHLALPGGPWPTIAAALLFGFGLLMPIAFALAVWRFDTLGLDPDSLPGRAGNPPGGEDLLIS